MSPNTDWKCRDQRGSSTPNSRPHYAGGQPGKSATRIISAMTEREGERNEPSNRW